MKPNGLREYQVEVGSVMYGTDKIESATLDHALFPSAGIGNTACATFTMTFFPTEPPPRMAPVRPYARDVGEEAWHPLGVFWIDQRQEDQGRLTLTCYDVMLKAEAIWKPSQDLEFPMKMEDAAEVIAATMGTTLDSRCVFNDAYMITSYPVEEYTMREILGYIAVAHCGNWIATAKGQLLLIPLFGSMPPETHYLIDELGNAITFGGTRILV